MHALATRAHLNYGGIERCRGRSGSEEQARGRAYFFLVAFFFVAFFTAFFGADFAAFFFAAFAAIVVDPCKPQPVRDVWVESPHHPSSAKRPRAFIFM